MYEGTLEGGDEMGVRKPHKGNFIIFLLSGSCQKREGEERRGDLCAVLSRVSGWS